MADVSGPGEQEQLLALVDYVKSLRAEKAGRNHAARLDASTI